MRLLFLTLGERVPSSRYRVLQYVPLFESEGAVCHVRSVRPDVYSPWIGSSRWIQDLSRRSKIVTAWQLALRLAAFPLVSRADVVVIQRPLLGIASPFLEEWVCRLNPRVVFDFDDAIYHHDDPSIAAVLEEKTARILRASAAATCGNSHLVDYASRFTEAHLVPTSTDVERIRARDQGLETTVDRLKIGWVGQSSNFDSLASIESVIAEVVSQYDSVDFVVISDCPYQPVTAGLEATWVPWSAATEVDDLRHLHIGLMPLSESVWSNGKCGGKLVDYYAAGLATISSDSVAARDMVHDGETGFVAGNLDDWRRHLNALVTDQDLRSRLGAGARERAESRYSIQANHRRLLDIYRAVSDLRR